MIKKKELMIKELRVNIRGGKGEVEFIHIFDRHEIKSNARICAKLVLNPGCSIGSHIHENEEEIYYILKGKGQADDNGNIRDVYEGDAIITGGGAYHSIANNGDSPLEIFAIVVVAERP